MKLRYRIPNICKKPEGDFFTDKIIEIVNPKSAEDFAIVAALLRCIKTTTYYVGEDKSEIFTKDKIKIISDERQMGN